MSPVSDKNPSEMKEVDVENFDFNNDIFVRTYGTTAVEEGKARARNMLNELETKKQSSKGFVNEGLEVQTNARLSEFAKEKMYPGDWNNSCLNLLESWYHTCKESAKAQGNAARSARSKHRWVSIPTIIAGTAATALSFFSAGDTCDPDQEEDDGLKYTVAILTSIVSILGGVSVLYSFQNKFTNCLAASGNFENLARRAQIQIYLPPSLRAHSELVLSEIASEFSSLTSNSPLL